MKHTESGLGFPLFRLVKGRLVATDEAHVLFRDVHDLHERIGIFQQAARNLRSSAEGKVRIGLLPSLALSVVPEAVARFGMIAPRAGFEIISVHHDSFRHTLVSRECDLVVGHHLLQGPEIHSISLGTGCVGVLFRRGLLTDSAEPLQLSALDNHDLISLTQSVAIANLLDGGMELRGREGRRTIAVNSVFVGAALARQGLGIAIVDEFTARGIMDSDLCFRPLRPAVTFDLKALHLAEQPLSRLTRSFLEVMRRIVSRPMVEPMDTAPYPQAIAIANH